MLVIALLCMLLSVQLGTARRADWPVRALPPAPPARGSHQHPLRRPRVSAAHTAQCRDAVVLSTRRTGLDAHGGGGAAASDLPTGAPRSAGSDRCGDDEAKSVHDARMHRRRWERAPGGSRVTNLARRGVRGVYTGGRGGGGGCRGAGVAGRGGGGGGAGGPARGFRQRGDGRDEHQRGCSGGGGGADREARGLHQGTWPPPRPSLSCVVSTAQRWDEGGGFRTCPRLPRLLHGYQGRMRGWVRCALDRLGCFPRDLHTQSQSTQAGTWCRGGPSLPRALEQATVGLTRTVVVPSLSSYTGAGWHEQTRRRT